VKVARRQQGTVVRGTVRSPGGPARFAAKLFASNRALSRRRPARSRLVQVGSRSGASTATGPTSFGIAVTRAARRALARTGRLVVQLRVVVTPPGGDRGTTTFTVVLRPR
jgi:hypothetical protein